MTGWRIDPAAVQGVLTSTDSERDGFERTKSKVALATGAGIAATPGTATADALRSIASDPFGLDVEAADRSVQTMVTAVGDALAAYQQGDELMADEILADWKGTR